MHTQYISDFRLFTSFPNYNLFCTFFLLRNFNFGYAHYANTGEHRSSPHFRYCTHCVDEIYQCFHTFRNCCLFSTFGLIPKFCSGGAPQANYGKHSLNHHFQHCAHCVYDIIQYLQTFRNCSLFCTYWLIGNFYSGDEQHVNFGKHSLNPHFQHCAHYVYEIYSVLELLEMAVFLHILVFRNLNSADSHHASYGERCSNHHFQHCAPCVYEIYRVFKVFEIAVCCAHFCFFGHLNSADSQHATIPDKMCWHTL